MGMKKKTRATTQINSSIPISENRQNIGVLFKQEMGMKKKQEQLRKSILQLLSLKIDTILECFKRRNGNESDDDDLDQVRRPEQHVGVGDRERFDAVGEPCAARRLHGLELG